jgi:hypothetical protein
LAANRAVFSLDSASCATTNCVFSATVQRRSWNQQKGLEAYDSKGKMGTFSIGFGILQPSRYSASRRAKSHASTVDRIVKDVPPEGEGMGAVVVGKTIGVVTSAWPAHLLDLSLKYFLQEVISSVQQSVYRSK